MGRFQDLRVWQDALSLAENIYSIARKPPFSQDFGLKTQITKAAVSISSNIAEGNERGSTKEEIHFFNIAKGSAAEVITQLHIAYRIGYIDKETFENLEDLTEKIRASIKNLIKSRRGSTL